MKVVNTLYTYGIEEKEAKSLAKKLKYNDKKLKLYVVCLPIFDHGIMEIYDYRQFTQPFYKKLRKDITVLGIAGDKAGAEEIVLRITQDLYDADNGFDMKKFFEI